MKLTMALAVLALAAASGCGTQAPQMPVTVATDKPRDACAAVTAAGDAASAALAPVAAVLAESSVSATEIAKATDDLKAAFTAMHVQVAAAADSTSDPQLKAKITEYQYWVEQAIVVVEGADARPARLSDAIELPELRDAREAVAKACS